MKKSDTLFVLGSGSSINHISEDEWGVIRESDTLGFNFWVLHDFVPNFYVFEPTHISPWRECFLRAHHLRCDDYQGTVNILKDGERDKKRKLLDYIESLPEKFRQNLYLSWDWEIPDESVDSFTETIRLLKKNGYLTSSRMPCYRKRASVFYIILLALRFGYKEIILCGVDLSDSQYFYEEKRDIYSDMGGPVRPVLRNMNVHKTNDTAYGELTISRLIEILNQEVLLPSGIELSVAFRSSKLYPMLPSYFGR
jgi:hypothetical protein